VKGQTARERRAPHNSILMSAEVYIKKYWDEEAVLYYLYFRDGYAVRQVEVYGDGSVVYYDADHSQSDIEMIYDQPLEELDLLPEDFIREQEFNERWREKYW